MKRSKQRERRGTEGERGEGRLTFAFFCFAVFCFAFFPHFFGGILQPRPLSLCVFARGTEASFGLSFFCLFLFFFCTFPIVDNLSFLSFPPMPYKLHYFRMFATPYHLCLQILSTSHKHNTIHSNFLNHKIRPSEDQEPEKKTPIRTIRTTRTWPIYKSQYTHP